MRDLFVYRDMQMRRRLRSLVLVFCLTVTACNTAGSGNLSLSLSSDGSADKSRYLAYGYRALADYAALVNVDSEQAARFAEKAAHAASRAKIEPDIPENLNYAGESADKVEEAYATLTDAIAMLDVPKNAVSLAEAQVNFDCWLGLGRSAGDGISASYAKGCADRFYMAINRLQLEQQKPYSIYFGSNATTLDEQALATVKAVADAFYDRPLWNVHLVGHTDSKGSYQDNVLLSMRRAVAVKNSLAQHGISPGKIFIDAVGEVGTPTDENDDSSLRRVDISIVPHYLHEDRKGPDIHKIVPHYFGSDAGDI